MIYRAARWHNAGIRRAKLPARDFRNDVIVIPDKYPSRGERSNDLPPIFHPDAARFESPQSENDDLVSGAYRFVINDHRTFLLLDRGRKRRIFSSNFKETTNVILPSVRLAIRLIDDLRPSGLYLGGTPHELLTFLLDRVAVYLNIPTFMRISSYLPSYNVIKVNVDEDRVLRMNYGAIDEEDKKRVEDLCAAKKESGKNFLSPLERDRQSRITSRMKRLQYLLGLSVRRPDVAINNIQCWRAYHKLAASAIGQHDHAVTFFLHYQPEKTTLPEGGVYVQQILAICELAKALPDQYTIYVREHPTTFTTHCSLKTRSPEFYRQITEIPRVRLLSMAEDTGKIIRNSAFVATVNGTVAGDAMCNGIPAITFGCGQWSGFSHPLLHKFRDSVALRNFVVHADSIGAPDRFDHALVKYLEDNGVHGETFGKLMRTGVLMESITEVTGV